MQPGWAHAQGETPSAASREVQVATPAPVTSPADVATPPSPAVAPVPESAPAPSPAANAAPATGIAVTLATVPDVEEEGAEAVTAADPMVCRTEVETGTIGRRYKICMTKSEWAAHTKATRKYMDAMRRSRSTQPGGEAGVGPSSGSPGPGRPGG